MINLFFDYEYVSGLVSYFSYIMFNSLVGITLLFNLALSSTNAFVIVFLCKFGLVPLISIILNYISYVSLVFLINYLFLKLSYFIIYLIISNNISSLFYRELIAYIVLVSLVILFVISLVSSIISFNLYSLVSSTFNYFILLILQTMTYNSIFSFLYIIFYTYFSFVLYYILLLFVLGHDFGLVLFGSRYVNYLPSFFVSLSFNLVDIVSYSLFSYILYTSIFIYLLLLSGLIPLFIYFVKLFFVIFVSSGHAFFFAFFGSFVIFFMFSFSFLNLILHLS